MPITRVSASALARLVVTVMLVTLCGGRTALLAQVVSGRIQGVVVERASGQPVPGATLRSSGGASMTTSDRNGRFVLIVTEGGPVSVQVEAPGYIKTQRPGVQVGSATILRVELEPTPNFLERVQVTAAKNMQSVGDLATLAGVVERSAIEARGDQTLTQAVANIPGLVVSGQAGSFDSVMLRGMPREGNEFTNTLLLIDGVPQVDSRNSARIVALPINDASRIEVVRGPNSALYGRTAIGGSVNVFTADPTPTPELRVDVTGGEFSTLNGSAAVSGPLSKRAGYYVSAAKQHNAAYYQSVTDFAVDKTAFFGKLTFVPDSKSFGSVSVNHVASDDSTPTNEPVIDGVFLSTLDPQFNRLSSFNLPGPNYHQGETRATLNYQRRVAPWVRLVEVFGFRRIQYKFLPDGDVIGSPFDVATHTFTQYPFEQQTDEDIYYQEARAEFSATSGRVQHNFTAGGSYEHNGGATNGQLIFTDPDTEGWPMNYRAPVFPAPQDWQYDPYGSNYNVGISALFGQYIVTPTARWIVTAGGRYDRLALDNSRVGGSTVNATFDAFSPKLSATFNVLDPGSSGKPVVHLYGTYSQAFLPPRRPSQLTPTTASLDLKPEDISNYEGGIKAGFAGGRLSMEAAYFDMVRDGIVTTVRQGPFFIPSNAGQQRFKGVETGAHWATPRLSLFANASFYHNRFGTYVIESSGGDTVLTGNRLPIAPDTVLNSGGTVTLNHGVTVTANVKRIGAVALDQINSVTLPGYTVVDAAVTWRRGPVRITLSSHNLLNAEYYWNGDTSIGESADPGRPRQLLVSTSVVLK